MLGDRWAEAGGWWAAPFGAEVYWAGLSAGSRLKVLCIVAICATSFPGLCAAQNAPIMTSSAPPAFVDFHRLPEPAQEYLFALGDRIQKAGKERTTLAGTFTLASGSPSNAQLVWQAPGHVWFQWAGNSGTPLIYIEGTGLANATSVTEADSNILESLFDDAAESFLYGFMRGSAYRLVGRRFRVAPTAAPGYTGPWYDLYVRAARVLAHRDLPSRQKFYFFDSQTKLLARVSYDLPGPRHVETEVSGWTTRGGQSLPGEIVRKENGVVIFTFGITQAAVGPAANDGLFSSH